MVKLNKEGDCMAAYLCRCCGAVLDVKKGMKVCGCGYCGITQTVPRLDFDEKAVLWERADTMIFLFSSV